MDNQATKKEVSPGVIIAAVVGLVAVIAVLAFVFVKGDPAAQAPNPPPTFNAAAKDAESHSNPMGRGGGGAGVSPGSIPLERGPGDTTPGRGPSAPPGPPSGSVVPR